MSVTPRPGRVDPTVRALLRGFVSPPLADRWAAQLQPIAVADHRAALTGAVTLLLDEVGVDPADLAVALVEDARWSSPDVGALLGLTALEVRVALAAGGRSTPRTPRHQREPWLLRAGGRAGPRRPGTADGERRDRSAAHDTAHASASPAGPTSAEDASGTSDDDVELRSRLPRRTGPPDRRPALVLVVAALLAVAGLAAGTTAPVADGNDVTPVASPSPAPSATPAPTTSPSPGPGTPRPAAPTPAPGPVVEELRLVTVDDVLSGRPSPADVGATFGAVADVRVWGALDRPADEAVVVRVAVTAPDGRRSVRPVLLPARVRTFALSLPTELGAAPGRWLVTAALGDGPVLRHEAQLVPNPTDG